MTTSYRNVLLHRSLLSLGATIAALPIFAADQTLEYTAGDASLGNDALTFEYSDGKITALRSNVASGDTVILKGDALAFGTDAKIVMPEDANIVISNSVTGTDLTVHSLAEDSMATYEGDLLDSTDYTIILANANLDEWEVVDGSNTTPAGAGNSNPNLFCAYNEKRTEAGKTVQMQWLGASYLKIIQLELIQQGENIAARAIGA